MINIDDEKIFEKSNTVCSVSTYIITDKKKIEENRPQKNPKILLMAPKWKLSTIVSTAFPNNLIIKYPINTKITKDNKLETHSGIEYGITSFNFTARVEVNIIPVKKPAIKPPT